MAMALTRYREKRDFQITSEPAGAQQPKKPRRALSFVIQKHAATALHYDFRLEWDGVLLSWAVPKGPSFDPSVKRLAMAVEDHPLEYAGFEGVIPDGQYGGGTVMVWDRGTWEPKDPDVAASMQKGELSFTLYGRKLRGAWALIRTKRHSWLLIKQRDEEAASGDVTVENFRSVISNRTMAEIAAASGGNVEKAAKADPS
jgi:bifunctional non-homologous end joining protein LigD